MNTQLKLNVRWSVVAMLLVAPLYAMHSESSLNSKAEAPVTSPVSSVLSPISNNGMQAPHVTPQLSAIPLQADIPFSECVFVENDQAVSTEQLLQQINEKNPYHAKLLQLKSGLLPNTPTIQAYMVASAEVKAAIIYAIEKCFPFLKDQAEKEISALHDDADTSAIVLVTGDKAIDDDFIIDKVFQEIDQARNDDDDDDDKGGRVCTITPRPGSTISNPSPSPSVGSVFALIKS